MADSDSSFLDRRGFLATGALGSLLGATAGGAGLVGCGATPYGLSSNEAAQLLARLERGLRAVRNGGPAPHPDDTPRDRALADTMKLGVQALTVADVARSVPSDMTVPPHLADALGRELPVLGRCADTYAALLAGSSPQMRRNVDQALRDEPDLVMQVAEQLDTLAGEHELAHESRLRVRTIGTNLTRRLRRQSASALVDETVGKVERIAAQRGADISFARRARSHALISSIWQAVDEGPPGGGAAGLTAPGPAGLPERLGRLVQGPVTTDGAQVQPGELTFEYDTGDDEVVAGGIMLGVGLGVFGISALIGAVAFSSPWGAIIGATPGAVLVVLGIIFMIIGARRGRTPR